MPGQQDVQHARLGAVPPDTFPGDAELSNNHRPTQGDRTLTATIRVNGGIALRDGWFHATDNWSSADLYPGDITSTGKYSMAGIAPGMVLMWQVYDADNTPTDYWVGAKYYTPAAGTNKWSCRMYQGNPTIAHQASTVLSPYVCTWANVRGWNPSPVLTVDPGTVVTNREHQKTLLKQYCNNANATKACAFVNFGYGTALGPSKIIGQREFNRGETESEHEVGGETVVKSSNSVGAELTVEVGFWEVWKASLTAKYEYSWENSQKFIETTKAMIDPESVGWLELAPNMQTTEGIWVVRTGTTVYVLPSVSLTAPLPDGGSLTVYECKLADYKNKVCTKGLETLVVPQ